MIKFALNTARSPKTSAPRDSAVSRMTYITYSFIYKIRNSEKFRKLQRIGRLVWPILMPKQEH